MSKSFVGKKNFIVASVFLHDDLSNALPIHALLGGLGPAPRFLTEYVVCTRREHLNVSEISP